MEERKSCLSQMYVVQKGFQPFWTQWLETKILENNENIAQGVPQSNLTALPHTLFISSNHSTMVAATLVVKQIKVGI